MGKVIFNQEKCLGCGACCSIAQENFTFNDEGKASMISDKLTNEAIEASEVCPTRAITIEKDEKCICGNNCTCGDDCDCTEDTCCCNDSTCNCEEECNCTEEKHCGCKN